MPEGRYPCPVCLGLPMEKIRFARPVLELDGCSRCGGIWFDAGEVQKLAQINPQLALKQINLAPKSYVMQCHQCSQPMDRNAAHCPHCRWHNQLDCPICQQPMSVKTVDGLKLDYCKPCKGVWFDNIELSTIWNRRLMNLSQDYRSGRRGRDDAADLFLDVLIFAPDVAYYGGYAVADTLIHAPELAAGAVEAVAHAPELAGNLIEGMAGLAGGIFEAIGEIIGGIFDL
ncbi:MAG: zf-TFIIB domain-containing protein [Candidatus Sericytochromatia bacterium]